MNAATSARKGKPTDTELLGAGVRELRERRRWSQAELARQLGISQPNLSQIERGQSSMTAEAFLRVLRIFNVGVEHFAVTPHDASPIQNALARHGARHLLEDDLLVPSAFDNALEVVLEVLRAPESPRHLTALAPVLVANIDRIALPDLAARLAQAGRETRLGWLLESVQTALAEIEPSPNAAEQRRRLRTTVVLRLTLQSSLLRPPSETQPFDLLDPDIRTQKTLDRVLADASPEADRWRIATRLRSSDFVDSLRAAHEAG